MHLRRIIVSNFKNIAQTELEFSPKFNSILGDNGEGKTNLLDAVYYLSVTKSFFNAPDRFVIRRGEERMALNGTFVVDEEEQIAISVDSNGQKLLKRNMKPYSRISDYIGLVPTVMVSPFDSELVNDSGEMRRRFMNVILFQTDRSYLTSLQAYNRLLLQRNSLLRSQDPSDELLLTLSEQLSALADGIFKARKALCEQFGKPLAEFYSGISGGKENVSLEYKSQLFKAPMLDLMKESLGRDKMMQYTTTGIQRDDMSTEFCVDVPNVSLDLLPLYLHEKLDRPVRVCGMVKNQGEPGGGPFIVRDADGSTSLQILESVQLNPNDPKTAKLMASSTHFNPVDLACLITDYKGKKFKLAKYVDPQAGFISSKSFQGRPLTALERPGLWNGAMSNWNTVFVEVPLSTFNPVKTVLDLLRPEHC